MRLLLHAGEQSPPHKSGGQLKLFYGGDMKEKATLSVPFSSQQTFIKSSKKASLLASYFSNTDTTFLTSGGC